ncbi:hypothetical protein KIH86_09380 [Paenibacillus sp. HN-1]|uniref:hypothetical protein n=1 Tax=Paenibacillus TaxID=44249 RepID=UPI001CA88CD7|nr:MULTISPECIES: hypothetical protein [Paenibacillus]MBY9077164.1 hypothetical protein [Paenibacillus sp. CGMCC 1.18879]MBY9084440.1 hypothetical protein [Paenibacillus sinensis]
MDYSAEVARFISKVTQETNSEDDVAQFLSAICSGLGGFLYITLNPECHEALADQVASDIKRSAVNASKDPGMQLMQMMKMAKAAKA